MAPRRRVIEQSVRAGGAINITHPDLSESSTDARLLVYSSAPWARLHESHVQLTLIDAASTVHWSLRTR